MEQVLEQTLLEYLYPDMHDRHKLWLIQVKQGSWHELHDADVELTVEKK